MKEMREEKEKGKRVDQKRISHIKAVILNGRQDRAMTKCRAMKALERVINANKGLARELFL